MRCNMIFSGKWYDVLKIIGNIILPAIAALYGTIAGIWGLPYAEQIIATVSAVAVFLNTLLKISSDKYWSEQLNKE